MAISPNFLLWLPGYTVGDPGQLPMRMEQAQLGVADGPPGAQPLHVDLLVPPTAHLLKAVSKPSGWCLSVPAQGQCNLEGLGWHRITCLP